MHMCHLAQQEANRCVSVCPCPDYGGGGRSLPPQAPSCLQGFSLSPLAPLLEPLQRGLSSCGSCLLCLQLSSWGMGDPSWGGWEPSFGTPFLSIPWARLGQPDSSHFPDPETGPPKGEVLAQGHAQGRGSHPHFGQNEAGLDQGQMNYEFPWKLGSTSRIRGPP